MNSTGAGASPALSEVLGPDATDVDLWAEIHRLRAAAAGPTGYASWQDAATAERVQRVRKSQQIETLLRGINDARQLMDPIWRERMGAESVREYVQRGLRCIDSAITDCRFTGPNVRVEAGPTAPQNLP